ncbi:MAG: SDR family oxidoreductase [Pseudomonadota bacterium]
MGEPHRNVRRARGIGQATAARLVSDGYDVVNLDRDPPPETGADRSVLHVACDLADATHVRDALADVVRTRTVVGLVNNAGYAETAPIEDTTPELMERTWRVNVLAPMVCAQAVLPSMKAASFGRIINICSRAALGRELRTAYAGSKGNLLTMTKTWALELGQQGITVNAIGPGPVATELYTRMNPPDSPRTKAIAASNPVGRIGTPDDIANAVAFFADPRSGYVNGQILYVCGGLTIGAGGT